MTSKLTSKGQTTLPKQIRDKLGVHSGDTLVYELEGNSVRLRKAEPFDLAWHRAISPTLAEWDSANDHENFDDLMPLRSGSSGRKKIGSSARSKPSLPLAA